MHEEKEQVPATPFSKVLGWLLVIFGAMPLMMYLVDRSKVELFIGIVIVAAGIAALAYDRVTGK